MVRGGIWFATLPPPRGSEPGKSRPVVIIQGDPFNKSAINTIICAIITSNTTLANAPANILLEKADSKLEKTSVINFSQIITIDRAYLTKQISMLPKSVLVRIDRSLKIVFDIE
jgi:mRNA interferase MazF